MAKKRNLSGKHLGRPFLTDDKRKKEIITIRLDSEQLAFFDESAAAISKTAPVPVTRTWVIMTLLELGLPAMKRKYLKKA